MKSEENYYILSIKLSCAFMKEAIPRVTTNIFEYSMIGHR